MNAVDNRNSSQPMINCSMHPTAPAFFPFGEKGVWREAGKWNFVVPTMFP
jgi:hypothetical protein